MVMPSGRLIYCAFCRRPFEEGDCRRNTCSSECSKAFEAERREMDEMIKLEIAKTKYRECPNWQI